MSKTKRFIPLLLLGCMILTAFTVPAADTEEADYDQIKSDLSGMGCDDGVQTDYTPSFYGCRRSHDRGDGIYSEKLLRYTET